MKIIETQDSGRLIPMIYFDICHLDGKTRQEISKLDKIQGFVTNTGRFVDRIEGAGIWLSENPCFSSCCI